MRVKIRIPPDGSFLSATIYEGLLRLLAMGAEILKDVEEIRVSSDMMRKAFLSVSKHVGDNLKIANTGVNDVDYIEALLRHFGIEYVDIASPRKKSKKKSGKKKKKVKVNKKGEEVNLKISYGEVMKHIASANIGWNNLSDVGLRIELDMKNKMVLVAAKRKDDALQLPVFKPDRYSGLRLPEAGIITDMFGFGLSKEASLLGLLGMGSAHVASEGNMHFFLFIDPSQAAEVIASAALGKDSVKYARALLDARDAGVRALRELGDAMVYAEAAVSRLLIDLGVKRAMRTGNIRRLTLRLVRLDEEGRTYKIYGDTPLTISSREASYAEVLIQHLDPERSPLIRCLKREALRLRMKGVQPCEESTHVINAVLWLMRYVSTGSSHFLAQYVRELVNAADVAEAAEKRGRAATYRGMVASLLRVM